jgi:predicted transcriptional regulator
MLRGLYQRVKKAPGKGLEKFLGELELAVMEVVWARGEATVSEVLGTLNAQNRALAYTSVMTVMSRLTEKGWLKTEKRGRAYVYSAIYSRQEAEAVAVGEVVHALLTDFGDLAVAQFVKELDEVDPERLNQLVQFVRGNESSDDRST